MLFLLFRLGEDPYAIDAQQVVEVLPVVNWKTVPQTVPGILGIIDYHGRMVPLLDLSQCVIGKPSRLLMSTRIVLIQYEGADVDKPSLESDTIPSGEEKPLHLLGLLVEEAIRTFRGSMEDFSKTGIRVEEAPYLGPVLSGSEGTIQFVDVERLLPAEVKGQLVGLGRGHE